MLCLHRLFDVMLEARKFGLEFTDLIGELRARASSLLFGWGFAQVSEQDGVGSFHLTDGDPVLYVSQLENAR